MLREPSGGQGVVIYVSPTKALVNQVQAEIAARFVKNYQYPGQKLCGEEIPFLWDFKNELFEIVYPVNS